MSNRAASSSQGSEAGRIGGLEREGPRQQRKRRVWSGVKAQWQPDGLGEHGHRIPGFLELMAVRTASLHPCKVGGAQE